MHLVVGGDYIPLFVVHAEVHCVVDRADVGNGCKTARFDVVT